MRFHGLTTAAGVWATAGVGMAIGAGMYITATGATVILIAAQCLFHANWKIFRTKKYFQVKISFLCEGKEADKVKELFCVEHFNRLTLERKNELILYYAILHTDREFSSERLNEIMRGNSFIRSIERVEDE